MTSCVPPPRAVTWLWGPPGTSQWLWGPPGAPPGVSPAVTHWRRGRWRWSRSGSSGGTRAPPARPWWPRRSRRWPRQSPAEEPSPGHRNPEPGASRGCERTLRGQRHGGTACGGDKDSPEPPEATANFGHSPEGTRTGWHRPGRGHGTPEATAHLMENPEGTGTGWHHLGRGHGPGGATAHLLESPEGTGTVAPTKEGTKTPGPPRGHRAPCSEPCGESPMARPSCPPPKEGTVTCAGALGTLYSASATSAARFSSTSWGHGGGVTERGWHLWVAPLAASPLDATPQCHPECHPTE